MVRALQVLARHTTRLGPAGPGLEGAVRRVLHAAGAGGISSPAAARLLARWRLFIRPDSAALYARIRESFEALHARHVGGRRASADQAVRRLILTPPPHSSRGSGDDCNVPALPRLPPCVPAPPPEEASAAGAQPAQGGGGLLKLPVLSIRFAHNDQSERFGRGWELDAKDGRGILQLAVELVGGLLLPEQVPTFTVCRHQGQWYCRSGNRRLAALRLALRFAPGRLAAPVGVKVVPTDEAFVKGTFGRSPKLTTHRNGASCEGQWLMIRETEEAVGLEGTERDEYGADLLSLLVEAASPADGFAVGGA